MFIPSVALAASPADGLRTLAGDPDSNAPAGGWSSLIGVVTAICGNILISFALNTQRYAHMRLSRDRDEKLQEKRRIARGKAHGDAGNGAQQRALADERARANAKAKPERYTLEEEPEDAERRPLIPKLDPARETSASSDETARPRDGNDDKDEPEKAKSYLKSPIWWLGISMMVAGEAGNFLAYGFAPASIVSPLGVVALVSNCLIAPLLLGERFRWRDALGVLIAVAGCVVVVLSASESNPKLDPDLIWHLITRWEFETYLGLTVFLIIALSVASSRFGEKSILIDLGLVALYGGYTALSTKGVASLLSNTIWRVFTFPITYLLVAVLVFTAVMQIKHLNRALQLFNATMVIPTQFVLFTLSVIIGSAVLYRDFEREQTDDAIKFVCGCALTFFGVWCITSGRGDESPDDDVDDEEDAISLIDEEGVLPDIRQEDASIGLRRQSAVSVGSSSHRPGVRRHRTDGGSLPREDADWPATSPEASGGTGPAQPVLDEQLVDMPPAVTAAVHTDSAAKIGAGSIDDPRKPPPIHATTSAPVVPTIPNLQSNSLRPRTPLGRTPSTPATPSPSKQSPTRMTPSGTQFLEPPGSLQRLSSRKYSTGLLPFTSPLSGSLSAIVADELRRGVDGGTLRRKSTRRGSTRQDKPMVPAPKRHSIASGDMPSDSEEAVEAAERPGPGGRMRSLSATLGDLFGSTRRQKRPDPAATAPSNEE